MTDFALLRQRMVDNQIRPGAVTDRDVIAAFLGVPREAFVDAARAPFAYADSELVMSAAAPDRRMLPPAQLARLIQALPLGAETRAMVIGCGSGYSAAILSRLTASVTAVEEDTALSAMAADGLRGVADVTIVRGPLTQGHPAGAPYRAILIEGSVELVPDALIAQLAPAGMLATVETNGRISRAVQYERIGESATKWPLFEAWGPPLPGFQRKPEFVF